MCLLGLFPLDLTAAPRAARSVHLGYPAPNGAAFYNEMIVDASTPGSYFMSCGWDTGYFGIQQLNRTNGHVVIFSVWDPTKGDDPSAVKSEDRVEVHFEGEGVRIRRFGGEGTGAQCMAPLPWRIGETNRFVIQAEVENAKTVYTAWVFRAATGDWWKLAAFRVRTGGRWLRGYYSFVEDFRRDGRSPADARRARFGHGWVLSQSGQWQPLRRARFTASNAEWEAKETIDAGVEAGWFYLATGGETSRSRDLQTTLELPERERAPPALPFIDTRSSP